jgi:hypothetical protein
MKPLLDQIVETKIQLDAFYEESPVRAVLRAPASTQDLQFLASQLVRRRLPFPPSYRELLLVCDGAIGLFDERRLELLTARQVAEERHTVDKVDFPTLSRFVIASGRTSEFISFDPDTVGPDGEMQVVHVNTHGDQVRGDNLVGFLEEYLEYLQNALRGNKADRDQLKDD